MATFSLSTSVEQHCLSMYWVMIGLAKISRRKIIWKRGETVRMGEEGVKLPAAVLIVIMFSHFGGEIDEEVLKSHGNREFSLIGWFPNGTCYWFKIEILVQVSTNEFSFLLHISRRNGRIFSKNGQTLRIRKLGLIWYVFSSRDIFNTTCGIVL